MSDYYTTKHLNKLLNFIENKEFYLTGFRHVVQYCAVAREMNNFLWDAGEIGDNERLAISQRIESAYRSAIEIFKKHVVSVLSKNPNHTIETIVSSIFYDIF